MKQKKLIDLYKEWMKSGRMHKNGLCNSLPAYVKKSNGWRLFSDQRRAYEYWAYNGKTGLVSWFSTEDIRTGFTPLRQTIVLFICAMNNEL